MKEAQWWQTEASGRILCTLCPRYCRIGEGQAGFCYIRKNIGGKLYSLGYGQSTGFAIDPIEKKPLNHFLPGTGVLSFGTAGCNLGCRFCQNWSISKAQLDAAGSMGAGPEHVVALALKHKVPSIAFTYNDPVIWGEFVIDISRLARERGLKSVMVTAGYITPEARPEVYRYIDAANVDLKGFTERFYHKVTFSHLDPLLDHRRRVDSQLAHLVAQVHDRARAAQPLERQFVNRFAGRHEMARRINVRPHVIGRHDVLRVDAMFCFALDVFHLKRRVIRPKRAPLVQGLRQVVDFHR